MIAYLVDGTLRFAGLELYGQYCVECLHKIYPGQWRFRIEPFTYRCLRCSRSLYSRLEGGFETIPNLPRVKKESR